MKEITRIHGYDPTKKPDGIFPTCRCVLIPVDTELPIMLTSEKYREYKKKFGGDDGDVVDIKTGRYLVWLT